MPSSDEPLSHAQALSHYERGPAELALLVKGMPAAQLAARPITGKWSTQEVLCHLADSEQVMADRIKRTLAMDRPALLAFDENRYVASLAYSSRDPGEELETVRLVRRQIARILSTLTPERWERQGMHNERGPLTVHQIVVGAANHLSHHMRFIAEKRAALGASE